MDPSLPNSNFPSSLPNSGIKSSNGSTNGIIPQTATRQFIPPGTNRTNPSLQQLQQQLQQQLYSQQQQINQLKKLPTQTNTNQIQPSQNNSIPNLNVLSNAGVNKSNTQFSSFNIGSNQLPNNHMTTPLTNSNVAVQQNANPYLQQPQISFQGINVKEEPISYQQPFNNMQHINQNVNFKQNFADIKPQPNQQMPTGSYQSQWTGKFNVSQPVSNTSQIEQTHQTMPQFTSSAKSQPIGISYGNQPTQYTVGGHQQQPVRAGTTISTSAYLAGQQQKMGNTNIIAASAMTEALRTAAKRKIEDEVKEAEESAIKKRITTAWQTDRQRSFHPEYQTPFKSHEDAWQRLLSYHLFLSPSPTKEEDWRGNFEKIGKIYLDKFEKLKESFKNIENRVLDKTIQKEETILLDKLCLVDEKIAFETSKAQTVALIQQQAKAVASGALLNRSLGTSGQPLQAINITKMPGASPSGVPLQQLQQKTTTPFTASSQQPRIPGTTTTTTSTTTPIAASLPTTPTPGLTPQAPVKPTLQLQIPTTVAPKLQLQTPASKIGTLQSPLGQPPRPNLGNVVPPRVPTTPGTPQSQNGGNHSI